MCRQYRDYWIIGRGVCGVFCLYAEESWWRDYSGKEARLECVREGQLGVGCGLVGWLTDHGRMCTIVKI